MAGTACLLTCATLVLTALRPGLAVSLVIFGWRHVSDGTQVSAAARTWMATARGFAQLHVSRMASASFRVIRPVLLEVLRTS